MQTKNILLVVALAAVLAMLAWPKLKDATAPTSSTVNHIENDGIK